MTRRILIVLTVLLMPIGIALAQSSSLYQASRARTMTQGTGDPAATTQSATNGTLRIVSGSAPVPVAPRNLAVIQRSLTSVAPPEPTVVKVNDLIGIIVRHRFRSQTDGRMQQKNEWDVQSKLEAWFRFHDRKWLQQDLGGGKPEVNFSHENEMKNQGRSNRQDVVETRIMGKVIDVKPNGNLIIVGASQIKYGDDGQIMMLSGEVNSKDVGPDRTITSDKIYDLDVDIKNSGTVSDATKRGWLKELLDGAKAF